MDARVIERLERHPQVHDWTVRRHRATGAQVYLAGRVLEAVRRVGRELYEVEVLNDHPVGSETRRGASNLPVGRDELDGFAARLDEAVAMARLVHNPPWALADPVDHPEVALSDPALASDEDAINAGRGAMELIRDLTDGVAGVRVSAAELFVTAVEEEIANSRGLHGTGAATQLLLELTLLAGDGDDEVEHFAHARARRLEDLRLPDLVTDGIRLARDAARARVPRTRTGPVVVRGMALEQLFGGGIFDAPGAYLLQSQAARAYAGLSPWETGASVYGAAEPTGDLLTLRSNARRPYGGHAYRFDDDGLPAQDLLVVEEGVLRARPATQRYAQYLGVPATGRPGVAEIGPGPTPLADLLVVDGPVIEVLAFSSPSVDDVTGNFGMEIRVGYEHAHGETHPVKGGSVTGNLFTAMAAARFSAETAQDHSVAGPRAIRFEALQVSGED